MNYHGMRMPMRPHNAQQMHAQLLQQQHQQRPSRNATSEHGGFAGPLAALDRAKPSTSHDLLSNDDDGETSSASEDSTASYRAEATASYKRPAEPSAAFRLPPSQRSRTTTSPLQLPGWLPVSSGGTFETGTAGVADAFEGHPRQLPRLAALETLLSSHNQQPPQLRSPSSSSLQQHHRQDFPATEATVQLPSLLHASKSSASSVGSLSSSTSSSPTCSPGLRSCSPPYGGRHELPSPACTQGPAAARTSTSDGGSVNVNQRWLAGTGSTNADNRRRVPRINALSPTKNGTRPQPWHTTALEAAAAGAEVVAAAAGTTTSSCWPTHAREGRREMNAQTTAGPYSNASGALAGYAREVVEERSTTTWAKQHGASAAWPLQRHHLHQQQAILTQHLSETEASPSSRTPSPLSSQHGREQFSRQQQQHHHHHHHHQQQETLLSGASSTFGSSTSTSSSSPEKRSWTPPASAAPAGEAHRGKWDEEAQAQASGSVGKQILQRYLTHLYPKASREVWSHDEEEVLWRAQKEYGNAWSYISSLLPGRSENAVKNHWYTQMRMFIGQRGNNASSSKPCPPPSSRTASSKSAGGKGGSRQNKQKREEDKIDVSIQQQQQQQQQQRTNAPGSPAGGGDGTETAASSPTNANNTPEPASSGTIAKAEIFDVHEEKQARADAVAALGMLFSQGKGNTSGADAPAEGGRR